MKRLGVALAVMIAWLSLGGSAHAQAGSAKVRFERGMRAYNLQKFEVALAEFQAAYDDHPDPAILFNIAQCQRQLGQYEAAAKSYRAYLGQEPNATNRDEVLKRIDDMEKAAQEKRAQAPPEGVLPPQRPPPTTAPAAAATEVQAAPPRNARLLRNTGIGVGAGGVALLALGGAFAGLAKSAGDSAYHGDTYDYGADNRYHGYQSAEIACFVVGGAALASGVVLIALGTRGARR